MGREALYGGAAGGGKSVALLAAALQFVDSPEYAALILRRTYKQLAKADSILAKAKEWLLPNPHVQYISADHKFIFPSGATLEFGHMEHEDAKYNYQGGSWHFVGVDEVTQFTEGMIAYPRTRQRRAADCLIPIRWRGGSNPGGISHEYVKRRFVKDENGKPIDLADRAFFPATIDDNPHIDRAEYIATLQESGIDPLTLAQLLKGDWDAVAGGRFLRQWFQGYFRKGDYAICRGNPLREGFERIVKPLECPRFLTIDPAASAKNTADWTVISAWAALPWGDLMWLDCVRVQREIPDIVPEIQRVWIRHRPQFAGIEAIYGNRAVLQLAQRATNPVINCRAVEPRVGGQMVDKLIHATPAINFAACGRVWLPLDNPMFPVDDVLGELTRFTGNEKEDAHDDVVDTLSTAVQCVSEFEQRPGRPMVLGGA